LRLNIACIRVNPINDNFLDLFLLAGGTAPTNAPTPTSTTFSTSPTASPDCIHESWIEDGQCDDATNTPECHFDGGDCCGVNVHYGECTKCQCLTSVTEPPAPTPTSPECIHKNWIEDGQCDDATNTPECNFDGGDCCGVNVNTEHCTECQCLTSGTEPPVTTPSC
jgi:hypothetical protein